jgi:NADPH:quinone reductase-like Zn-dependent oxidoreductase
VSRQYRTADDEGAMKAIVRGASGSPELRDVDVPVPTENEVLVRVHASSLNDYELFILGCPPMLYHPGPQVGNRN